VHDPIAEAAEAERHYGIALRPWEDLAGLSALVVAVGHRAYRERPLADFLAKLLPGGTLVDVKSILPAPEARRAGVSFWRL
jgi:UDP-N-acetyl-D-galactosamine dehydrogenase